MTPAQIQALLIAEAAKHGVDITKPGELERRLQAAKAEDAARELEPEFEDETLAAGGVVFHPNESDEERERFERYLAEQKGRA